MGRTPVKVSQLNTYIGRILKTDPILSSVNVIGEISNLKFHSSGHVYFSLKDETSRVNCFLPSRILPQIICPMEEGMEVVVSGYISVYERGGYYSLNVTGLETAGIGELAKQFELLKKKLEQEGLFDPAAKKPLPFFPEKVAVVTSPTGAAIRDILKIIKSRNDYVDILICPVLVQGPRAAADIAAGLDRINREHKDVDVIICGRGGGSMEELWAFNEEAVARSIARSEIPVISAVGHETDVTIADFVADIRAETPTAAAQMAVPDTARLKETLTLYLKEMREHLQMHLRICENRLRALDPSAFAQGIRTKLSYEQVFVDDLAERMERDLRMKLQNAQQRLQHQFEVLEAGDPYGILQRGYSMVTAADGSIVRSIDQLSPEDNVTIRTGGGSAEARILTTAKEEVI